MKKIFFIIFYILFFNNILLGQTIYCTKYENELILNKSHLTISYSKENKIPNYVGYLLTPNTIKGNANRSASFYTDNSIPFKYRTYSKNYANTGYDRGHMSPAANWKYSQSAMKETFYMSNICPQNPYLNRKYWVQIEDIERMYASYVDSLYVITGSICKNDGIYIKNNIKVPYAFYKTCIGIKNNQVIISIGWIYQNINDPQFKNNCETTIDNIQNFIKKDLYSGFWFNNLYEKNILKR